MENTGEKSYLTVMYISLHHLKFLQVNLLFLVVKIESFLKLRITFYEQLPMPYMSFLMYHCVHINYANRWVGIIDRT